MIKQEKLWKFLAFVLFSFPSVDAASTAELRDNVFATLDLESSFVSTETVNKGITRFKLDFGYDQTFSVFSVTGSYNCTLATVLDTGQMHLI